MTKHKIVRVENDAEYGISLGKLEQRLDELVADGWEIQGGDMGRDCVCFLLTKEVAEETR